MIQPPAFKVPFTEIYIKTLIEFFSVKLLVRAHKKKMIKKQRSSLRLFLFECIHRKEEKVSEIMAYENELIWILLVRRVRNCLFIYINSVDKISTECQTLKWYLNLIFIHWQNISFIMFMHWWVGFYCDVHVEGWMKRRLFVVYIYEFLYISRHFGISWVFLQNNFLSMDNGDWYIRSFQWKLHSLWCSAVRYLCVRV